MADRSPHGTLRKKLIKKRGHKCELCDYTSHIELHHIIGVAEGGLNVEHNCVLLCPNCHAEADRGEIAIEELMELHEDPKLAFS